MNTHVLGLAYGGNGCKIFLATVPSSSAADEIAFIQVVRDYLTYTLDIVVEARVTFDWRERSSFFLYIVSSMKRI